jgi:cytochrome c oxidase subunit 2
MGEFPLHPPAASSFADDVDLLFYALLFLTVVFTVIVIGAIAFLTVYYRRGNKVDRSRPVSHNTLLELAWSGGPMILALGMFLWSAKIFANAYSIPANSKEVFVIGKQWMWHLQHANGIRENNELHLPVDEPVKLTMISQDVIHAFYVPEFRIQRHVEPGRYTSFSFTPTKIGKYHLYCNMYCGTQHSEMGGWVYVQSRADYDKWVASGGGRPASLNLTTPSGDLTMAQQGKALFEKNQCNSCHVGEAVTRRRGPSLAGIYGKNRQLVGGRVVKADDGYLRDVVYYPSEYPLPNWPQGMPSYKGVLTEEEVLRINAYIKTLGTAAEPVSTGTTTEPGHNEPSPAEGGNPSTDAPAADTDNQQWRYMYGGEQYH